MNKQINKYIKEMSGRKGSSCSCEFFFPLEIFALC